MTKGVCPALTRLRRTLPELLTSEETRLVSRHLHIEAKRIDAQVPPVNRGEAIALATCVRFWMGRHSGPTPSADAVALVLREGMDMVHDVTLKPSRALELALKARHLASTQHVPNTLPNGHTFT